MAPPNDEFRWVQPFDPRSGQAAVDPERSAYYAQRYAAQRAGRGPAIVVENLDSEFRKALVERRRMASVGINADDFPFSVTPRGNIVPKGGFSRVAQSMDRVFDIPYNPYRTRVAVETPVAKREIRARCRYYMKYEPLVASAIALHTEYPISSFHLAHNDKGIEQEINDMADELDLFEFILQMVHEFWGVGVAFPCGIPDDAVNPTRWTRFVLLDPDKVVMNAHPFVRGNRPYQIQLMLDDTIRAIVEKGPNDPNTGELFRRIPPDIRKFARMNQPVPMKPVQVSKFARTGSTPFDMEGESIVENVFHSLAYKDKLRDAQYCHPPDVEVLTDHGFVKIPEVTTEDKVACFDPATEEIAFLHPTKTPSFDFDGTMVRFKTRKIDIEATANHRMLVTDKWAKNPGRVRPHRRRNVSIHGEDEHLGPDGNWRVVRADQVTKTDCFRTNGNWTGWDVHPRTVMLGGKDIPIRDFMEFAGYYVSEGWSTLQGESTYKGWRTGISQKPETPSRMLMASCLQRLPFNFKTEWKGFNMCASGEPLARDVRHLFGRDSFTKKIPAWFKQLPPELQEVFLRAAVLGDGNERECKHGDDKVTYSTVSESLADDIQEMAWRCGFCPIRGKSWKTPQGTVMYPVYWSWDRSRGRVTGVEQKKNITKRHYKGKVYCLSVPTEFFVVRQNGKIVIVGNTLMERHATPMELWKIGRSDLQPDPETLSAFRDLLSATWLDPNRAFVWGPDVSMDVIGGAEKVIPLRDEYQALEMEILSGLMINKAMIYGEGPTYANASVGLEVLVSRYVTLRHRVEKWIRRAVFEPIFRIHNIYRQTPANLQHRIRTKYTKTPDLPTVRWDKANLRENDAKVKILQELVQKDLVARKLLYQALGIDEETAERDLIEQDRKDAARARQKKILKTTKESPEEEPTGGPPGAPPGGPMGEPMEGGGEALGGGGMITPPGLGTEVPAGVGPELPPEFPGPEAVETLGEEGL